MAHNEQIFTPQYIVEDILDRVGYYIIGNNTSNIRKKHIIDNSCGNGAFLNVIVERYIDACKIDNLSEEEFSTLKTNFNVPSLGKLACTLDKYNRVKKRFKLIKNFRNAENK